jgi:hypothetical protein
MSENEATRDDGAEHRLLGVALTDLADSMSDDPYRLDGVHAKARRLRNRRRAARVTVGVVSGAAVVAMLVAVRPGPAHVSTLPASQPSTTIAEPTCAAALAAAPTQAVVPPTPGAKTSTASDTAAQPASDTAAQPGSAAAKQGPPDTADVPATGVRGIKGPGTIVSATASTVTITPDPQSPNQPAQPAQITAIVGPVTEFYDGNTKVDALPPLSPGDRVAFGAAQAADGSYQLGILVVHVPAQPARTAETVDPAANAAVGQQYVKAPAEVVSVQPDSLTIRLTDGPQANQVLTTVLGPNTVYTAGDQKCVNPVFTAGQAVGVLLAPDNSGAYTAVAVALSQPVRASRGAAP